MRCTVLGAQGFIGSALADRLRADGHEVYTPGRGEGAVFARPLGHVFYCIGVTADFRYRPFETVEAHVSLLAEYLHKADFESLLYLSSTRVYARASSTHEQAILAVDPNDPSDLYNLSKLMGESLCLHGQRQNVRIVRLSNVAGFDPYSENFLSELIREALAGHIVLRSDPAAEKDYIVLDDVIEILPRIAFGGRERLYNVASGLNIRNDRLCEQLRILTGCTVEFKTLSDSLSFPPIDNRRLCQEFHYQPKSLLEVLPELVRRWRDFQEANTS